MAETKKRSLRGLTSKKWKVKTNAPEKKDDNENNFLVDIYTNLSGYEDKMNFHSILSRLINKHHIDVTNQKVYDKNGCRFLELLISDEDNDFYTLEVCFG